MTHPLPPASAGAILRVDLAALVANWRTLGATAAGAECAAVVKADAYGIGTAQAVRALARAGCRTFFVAHAGEGAVAREAAPESAIYVLNGLLPGAAGDLLAADLRPVLGSAAEVAEWRAEGGGRPAALHVDTGMNRLGLAPDEVSGRDALGNFTPSLVMSHFTASENPGDPASARQVDLFERVRWAFPGVPASLANSSGIFLPSRPHHDLVRPGYALYGGNPTPDRANPMREVVRLEACVIQIREVPAGAPVGYCGAWTAPGARRLATISLGYADGYPRGAGLTDMKARAGATHAEAVVEGVRCPVIGTISMDLAILDVTGAPPVGRGDRVTLIGDGLGIDEVGARAGTIGYEILTGLGHRYARLYSGG